VVGVGRSAELPGIAVGLGSRAFVCTGSRPARHAELLTTGGDAPPSTELRTEIHQAAQKIEAAFVQLVRLTE